MEGRLGGGNRGEVWEVKVRGDRYATRLSARAPDALDWELRLLDCLRDAGLLAPASLPAPDGRRQVDGVVLYGWIEGDPPESEREWRLVADELGRLHELTRGWPQRPGFRSTRQLLAEDAGGDVRLDVMPARAVERVREAWAAIGDEPVSVVHGDPSPCNIRVRGGMVGLLDWDESRVDASVLDLAALPLDLSGELGVERLAAARRAADAWEAANGWLLEPEYARRRLARLDQV